MKKKQVVERKAIHESPQRRPYGAQLTILLEEETRFPIDGDCELLVSPNYLIRMMPIHDDEKSNKQTTWDIHVEGFATAYEAEQAGLQVALGFFWSAVQGGFAIRLKYHTPLPCMVYDRNKTSSIHLSDSVSATIVKSINNIVNPIDQVLRKEVDIDPKLLVAIELFASARMETTERAKFVGLVSSLEPIAEQEAIEIADFSSLVKEFKQKVSALDIDESLRNSLMGRIEKLKRESISRAIQKLVVTCLPDDTEALQTIKDAYDIRSAVLHHGSTVADLGAKSKEIEAVIKNIFQHLISP